MHGTDICQNVLFMTITMEDFVPAGHPLCELRDLISKVLKGQDGLFGSIYAAAGREPLSPVHQVHVLVLQIWYTIRSERQLIKQVRYNTLYCRSYFLIGSSLRTNHQSGLQGLKSFRRIAA